MNISGLRITAERNARGDWHAVVYLGDRELAEANADTQAASVGLALGHAASILLDAEAAHPTNGGPAA